jgi:hypothetical protein
MTVIRSIMLSCFCASVTLFCSAIMAGDSSATPMPKIAVFAFELEDLSAAAVILGQSTTSTASLDRVTQMARNAMAKSARYDVIDATPRIALKDCDGCEAQAALELGADQSLIGVVRRVSQTDYYLIIQIRDAHTGKILAQEAANFAGGEDGWASGVRMLIIHQVLPVLAEQPQAAPVCRLAEVNPVSGHAECVDPRGAPVDPPPPRENRT